MTVVTIFMFESQLMQMPGPGTLSFIGSAPGIFCCAKALGLGTHFGAKAPECPEGGGGGGNQSNWYLHYKTESKSEMVVYPDLSDSYKQILFKTKQHQCHILHWFICVGI